MEKIALLFNFKSGKSNIIDKVLKAKKKLSKEFLVDIYSFSDDEKIIMIAKKGYDYLVVCGGDGTMHKIVNIMMKTKEINFPTIGYIPTGTMNDCMKGYGITSFNKALKIIMKKHCEYINLGKCNNDYFLYLFASGAYSDISYLASRKYKKNLGKLSYYFLAIKEIFKKRMFNFYLDNNKYQSPFIMILNGSHVGGLKINKGFRNNKLLNCYITAKGVFNGLLHYFFDKKNIVLKSETIKISQETKQYCLDGEMYKGQDFAMSKAVSKAKFIIK